MASKTYNSDVQMNINAIINELYFKTADDTYIVARWCSIQRLSPDFIWNAIHALEKYMKAAILYNGGSVLGLGHNIGALYEKLERTAGNLLPNKLEKPKGVSLPNWRETKPSEFLQQLMNNGGASVRYNERGYVHSQMDLFLLDEIVWHIRRLCLRLDRVPFKRLGAKTQRDILKDQPDFANMHFSRLDTLYRDKNASEELKQAAFNLNIRFAPEDFPDEGFRLGTNASNPALNRYMVRHLKSSNSDNQKVGKAVRDWYLNNNSVGKALKSEISQICVKS